MAGITDVEVRFPEGRIHVKQMHQESGRSLDSILKWTHCEEIPVFGEFEPAWELLAAAASSLLERTGVAPDDIGQVIVAGSAEWDHPGWSPATKVADELGIRQALCFEVVNFCNSAATAIQIAADAIAAGRTRQVLVLLGERLSRSVDYSDPESVALFNTGDSAVALLVGADNPLFEYRHTQAWTDPAWCDHYLGEYEDTRVIVRRRARRSDLPKAYFAAYERLVAETLSALDRSVDDVRYFLINQMDRRMHEHVLRRLGIPPERSVFNYDQLGHMGAGDTFIALGQLHSQGRLTSGDLVLLATSGTGFSWGVTALEYR